MQSLKEVFSDSGCEGPQHLVRQREKGKQPPTGGIYTQENENGAEACTWMSQDQNREFSGKTVSSILSSQITKL